MENILNYYPRPNPNTTLLLNIPETAEILGISAYTVRKLIKNGELAAFNLGLIKVPKESIKKYFLKEGINMTDNSTSTNNNFHTAILYTVPEVAELLHTTKVTVRDLIKYGHIKAVKIGEIKVSAEEIIRFVRDSENMDYSDPQNPIPLYN